MRFPRYISFTFLTFLSGLLIFSIYRLIYLVLQINQLNEINRPFYWVAQAIWMGVRYDALICGYILAPLFIFFILSDLLNISYFIILKVAKIYCFLIFSLAFFISAADIPFYMQFGERLSSTAFAWSNSPGFVLKLVFSNVGYWGYLIPFMILSVSFIFLLNRIIRKITVQSDSERPGIVMVIFLYILSSGFIFLCMRGRLSQKTVMQQGTAFISEYSFINEMGLNPAFTLISSIEEKNKEVKNGIHFLNDNVAMTNVRRYLNIHDTNSVSPVARYQNIEGVPNRMNVVIVIMESMCTFLMGDYNGPHLTPQLDSLKHHSFYFKNFYSAGIHTYIGIYSTLCSYPALLHWQPMENIGHDKYDNIASTLKQNGYNTIYFTTHDDQFDNAGGFLRYNGFDRIVCQKDYPASKVISVLGVPDHYMFDFSIPLLNELSEKGKPFLSVYMTASNHGPWRIPEDIPFKPDAKNQDDRAAQYSDWAIGHFISNASSQPWFKNTLFVFLGDHGVNMGHTYDMPLSFHHIPCIFYIPGMQKPIVEDGFGGQIDVFPTIMDILNIPFLNNTLGIDLLKEKRPFIYFSQDDKIGCIGPKYYYILRSDGRETLYDYSHLSTENLLLQDSLSADSMRNYTYSFLQAAQWLIRNNKFTGRK